MVLTYTVAYDHVNVETAADGSGTTLSATNLSTGNSITVYAIARESDNTFIANVAATWSLINKTGFVADSDLVPSGNNKSAVLTAHLPGSAQINAAFGAVTANPSGVITVSSSGTVGTWTNDVDGNWTDATKWSSNPNAPSVAGDLAVLGVGSALRTVALNAIETVGIISFTNSNSFVVSGTNTFTLDNSGNGAIIQVTDGSANAIQTPLSLNDNANALVSGGKSLSISGNISSTSTSKTLTVGGPGTLALSGNNSYGPSSSGTVGTTVSGGGTLQVGSNTALGAGDVTNTQSSTLRAGAAGLSVGNNFGVASSTTLTVDNNGNALTLGGTISGGGTLAKISNGTLTLGGANTYSGNTVINAGTVSISSGGANPGDPGSLGAVPAAVTANNVILNGGDLLASGTLALNGNRGIGIGPTTGSTPGTGLIDAASGATFAINGIIQSAGNTGANNLTVNSGAGNNGTVMLAAANTFQGTTKINNGTLMLSNSLALQNSTLDYNNYGGSLDFGTNTTVILGGLSGAQNLSLLNDSAASVALTVGTNNSSTVYSGNLTGSGSLGKAGTGTLTLSNPGYTGNTVVYNGGLNITGGTLNSHLDLSAQYGVVYAVISGGSTTVTSPNGLYITSISPFTSGVVYGNAANLTITNGAQVTANADGNGRAISYGASGNGRPAGNGSLTIGTTGGTTTLVTANGALDMFATAGGGTAGNFTVNLNGGTLALQRIQETTSGSQSGTFIFNGGVLRALASDSTAPFIPSTPTQFTTPINTGGAIIDPNGFTITIASVLTHGGGTPDGGLTLAGNGSLAVTNANQYTGGTVIKAGTLIINGSYALGGANFGGLTISNGATLQYLTNFTGNGSGDLSYSTAYGSSITLGAGGGTIDLNGNNVTYANSIGSGGIGGLTLQSTVAGGVLTLSASNNYAGNTTIGSGVTLMVNNPNGSAVGSGNVTVQSGGTLDDDGIISGNVTVANGGTYKGNGLVSGTLEIQGSGILAPGDSLGTNTVSALTLDSGAICNFEFTDTANDLVVVTNPGVLTLNGGVFNLYQAGGTLPWTTTGTYNLIQYSGSAPVLDSSWTTSSGSNPHIGNPQANFLYSFHATGGYLTLTITLSGSVISGTWTNDVDSSWSTATNWSSNPNVPSSTGDLATFGTGSALRTVTLDANKTVGTITMNNNNSFVIANSGKTLTLNNGGSGANVYVTGGTANQINAAVALADNLNASVSSNKSLAIPANIANASTAKTLTASGTGTLVLSGNNSYGPAAGTVGTILNSGTVQVGNNSALGNGDLSASGGTLQIGAPSMTLNNNIQVNPGTTLTVDNNGNDLVLGGKISGNPGNLMKIGNGTLTLANENNNYSGYTFVNGGVLSIDSSASSQYSAAVNLNGGTLLGDNPSTLAPDFYTLLGIGPSSDSTGGTGTIDAASGQEFYIYGSIDSAGNSGVNNLVINGGAGHNGTVYLDNQMTAGDTFNGTTTISNGVLLMAHSLSLQNSTLNYDNQGGVLLFDSSIGAATLGGLRGAQNLALTNLGPGALSLTTGNNNGTNTYSGNLTDAGLGGSLTKVGTGWLTLAGNNSYIGNTVVNGGTLELPAGGSIACNLLGGHGFLVDGGTLTTSNGTSTFANYNNAFIETAGAVTTGTFRSSSSDGTLFAIMGGSFSANAVTLQRTVSLGTVLPTATAPIAAATGSGFYVNSTNVASPAMVFLGSLTIATANSSASARVDAGTVVVTNEVLIGNTSNTRVSILQVNGGVFSNLDTLNGIVLSQNNGTSSNNSELYLSGGATYAQLIAFGTAGDTVGGAGAIIIAGGGLYLGSGGITQSNVTGFYTPLIALTSGILGATADWSCTNDMVLSGTNFVIQAGDALGAAHNITLSGVLSGMNLIKSGAGTLTLSGVNTYTGTTTISNGTLTLSSSGSIATTAQVGIGAGATFDVSALGGYTFSGASPVQTLAGISSTNTATINATGNTVTLASGAKALFQAVGGASPSVGKISVTGNLALMSGNAITINVSGSTLGAGTYRLLDCTGTLSGTANATPVFTGLGATPGAAVSIVTTTGAAGHVDLVVGKATPILQTASASTIVAGQALSASTLTVTFTNAAGTVVPGSAVFTSPGTMPPLGTTPQPVQFTPADTTDYNAPAAFNVNVTVVSTVLIPTQSAHITGFSLTNGNVVINATNGQTGGTYYLLSSTNLAFPLSQWTPVATNVVSTNGASGAFAFTGTNAVGSGAGQRYYILSNTNN